MNTRFVRFPKLIKPWLDLIQGMGTVVALLAALWWFHAQRFTYQNLKLEQTVTQRHMPGSDKRIMIAIDVRATNIGKVGIELGSNTGKLEVFKVIPEEIGSKPINSFDLSAVLLQPGESDQVAFQLIPYDENIRTIQINSYYKVPDTGKYWSIQSVVDLGKDSTISQGASTP